MTYTDKFTYKLPPLHNCVEEYDPEEYRDDDRDDYFVAEGLRDKDEEQAELEGEDLYEDETGFVVGQRDLEREMQGFAKLGIENVDEYEPDMLDDAVYELDPKDRRAAERRMRFRDRTRARPGDRTMHKQLWRKILEMADEEFEDNLFARISERVTKRRTDFATAEAEAPDLSRLESAKAVLHSNPNEVTFDDKYQQAIDCCFRYKL